MANNITWVLIADASKARLFSMHKAKLLLDQSPSHLKLIRQFNHEESRLKTVDLVSDKMGEYYRGSFEETSSPKLQEADVFAIELIKYLNTAKQDKLYRDLILVAPPTFMGLLHKHMTHEMQKIVSQDIEKDYTQSNGVELIKNLMIHL